MTMTGTGCSVLVFALGGSLAFAQMGGGMNEGPKGGGRLGHMMDGQTGDGSNGGQKSGAPHGQMAGHGQMMAGMADLGQQMTEMMGTASSRMKDLPDTDLKTMAGLMKDMGQQMMAMSSVMDSGTVSAKEMKRLQDKMTIIKTRMSGTDAHK